MFILCVAPFLKKCGRNSAIVRPSGIEGIRNICIGDDVYVAESSILAAVRQTGTETPELVIGSGSKIGRSNHIYSTTSIIIEPRVLTASNVYIADNSHQFHSIATAICEQPIRQLATIRIGEGSWLGQNVCIIGSSVGKGCVIGANSVVISDIPDYCVAAGVPARVIRRFDDESGSWIRVAQESRADLNKLDK
jgi:acetyltransferase-like isoleucine patch superfamily enzyme